MSRKAKIPPSAALVAAWKTTLGIETALLEALGRLCQIARRDTGQSRRVANFLLAWHNAEENGGWDPTDLWHVDTAIAEGMLAVPKLTKDSHRYPSDLGFEPEIKAILRLMARRAYTLKDNFDSPVMVWIRSRVSCCRVKSCWDQSGSRAFWGRISQT